MQDVLVSLEACRVNAKKSREEWARLLSVAPSTIFNWETGRSEPTLTQVRKISDLSGIPMDCIISGKQFSNSESG